MHFSSGDFKFLLIQGAVSQLDEWSVLRGTRISVTTRIIPSAQPWCTYGLGHNCSFFEFYIMISSRAREFVEEILSQVPVTHLHITRRTVIISRTHDERTNVKTYGSSANRGSSSHVNECPRFHAFLIFKRLSGAMLSCGSRIVPPDQIILDSVPNLGPLISRWKIKKFKNCWNKSFRTFRILKLLYQQFSNVLISQRNMSGPRLGTLSINRWSGGPWTFKKKNGRFSRLHTTLFLFIRYDILRMDEWRYTGDT
jgi:hypothetical protein